MHCIEALREKDFAHTLKRGLTLTLVIAPTGSIAETGYGFNDERVSLVEIRGRLETKAVIAKQLRESCRWREQ